MSLPTTAHSQFEVQLSDNSYESWPIIVIVDHPGNPPVALPYYRDAFAITLNDWRELNKHLRSIHEILRYVKDVLAQGPQVSVPLGAEFDRFASLVDFEASSLSGTRGEVGHRSFAAVLDPYGLAMYRELVERTWGPNDYIPGFPAEDYRPILNYLDDVPAVVQVHVGRWIMELQAELKKTGHRVSGTTLLVNRPLIYICDYAKNAVSIKDWRGQLFALTALRASEWREQARKDVSVLGISVRVGSNGNEYTYALLRRGSRFPNDLRRSTQWLFGAANFATFEAHNLKLGRNEPCPCGSGWKYKHCHLSKR
jgi:hypothetical protein